MEYSIRQQLSVSVIFRGIIELNVEYGLLGYIYNIDYWIRQRIQIIGLNKHIRIIYYDINYWMRRRRMGY